MEKQRKIKHMIVGLLVAVALAIASNFVVGGSPAHASGSTIDIGYTIISGGYIKGSGSDYNTGDYANVCVAIMHVVPGGVVTETLACRSNLGHNWWSAPDFNYYYYGLCGTYYTRITAYNSAHENIANKNSNRVTVSSC